MSRLLGSHTLLLPKDKGIAFSPEENGQTYIENAIIKAEALYSIVKAPVISDDSGLSVKALGGAPGIHTARYGDDESSHQLSDRDRYMLLLKNMEGVKDRSAVFTTALCLILDEKEHPLLLCKRVEILNAAGHDVIVNLYGVVIDYENEDPVEFEIKRDSLYELATEWLQKKKASKTAKKK